MFLCKSVKTSIIKQKIKKKSYKRNKRHKHSTGSGGTFGKD